MASGINMPAVTAFAQDNDEMITMETVTKKATVTDADALDSVSDDKATDTTDDQKESIIVTEGQDFKVEYDEDSGYATKSENTSNDLIDEYGNFYCLFKSNADNVWNYGTFNGIIYSDESRIAVAYHDKKNDEDIKLGECNVIHKPIVEADLDTISV